jgi:DnaJ-class molecular chaperone
MRWKNIKRQLPDELARLSALEPHKVLDIAPDAGVDAIKAAYRRLARIYHPDRSDPFMRKHNEQVMKIVNDAYHQLMSEHEGEQ